MLKENQVEISAKTGSHSIVRIEKIQELWSGYGSILRVFLSGGKRDSVIVKNIVPPTVSNHPRGWDTKASNARKIKSYEVEMNWYTTVSSRCNDSCRIPEFIHYWKNEGGQFLLLEDLNDAGFPLRKSDLSIEEISGCLKWLANFHAAFLNSNPNGLWEVGTYWHLATRRDEYEKMVESDLKKSAFKLDAALSSSKYLTLVHGDAKVANFCFGERPELVAAVDFQYVGAGCGMKDVAYFLGSVLSENELEFLEEELLKKYFSCLRKAPTFDKTEIDFFELEREWRRLYPIAWADFTRFLLGWMPTHQKLNRYSDKMVEMALRMI